MSCVVSYYAYGGFVLAGYYQIVEALQDTGEGSPPGENVMFFLAVQVIFILVPSPPDHTPRLLPCERPPCGPRKEVVRIFVALILLYLYIASVKESWFAKKNITRYSLLMSVK